MTYSIKFDKVADCIKVVIEGNFSLELLKSLAPDVATEIKKTGCKKNSE